MATEVKIEVKREEIGTGEEEPPSMKSLKLNGGAESEIGVNLLSSQTIPLSSVAVSSSSSSSSPITATSSSTIPMEDVISEATWFSKEVKKLKEELDLARQKIVGQDAEINKLNVKLVKAQDLVAEQKRQLEIAVGKETKAEEKIAKVQKILREEFKLMASTTPATLDIAMPKTQPEPKILSKQPIKVEVQTTSQLLPETVGLGCAAVEGHEEDTSETRLKGFFCICGAEYNTRSNLIIHIRSFKKEDESKCKVKQKKPNGRKGCLGCRECGQTFPSLAHVRKHHKSAHSKATVGEAWEPLKLRSRGQPVSMSKKGKVSSDPVSISAGKKHCRDIAKRQQGIFCICGIRFNARTSLDAHIQAQNKRDVEPSSACSPPPSKFLSVGGPTKGTRIAGVRRGSRRRQNCIRLRMAVHAPQLSAQSILHPSNLEGLGLEPSAVAPPPLRNDEEKVEEKKEVLHKLDAAKCGRFLHCSCGKDFVTKKGFQTHVKQKTEKWKFRCEICDRLFFYSSTKNQHMMKIHKIAMIGSEEAGHTGGVDLRQPQQITEQNKKAGPKFPCNFCEKSFTLKSYLTRHLERMHKIEGVAVKGASRVKRQTQCIKCGKKFNTQVELLCHNKVFHKTSFEQVARSRMTKKKVINAIACVDCGSRFRTFADLRKHQKAEHKEKAENW